MSSIQLLYPISALVLLHFLVAGRLLYLRIRMGVFPDKREALAPHELNTSNNYKNLFEMPVIFYVLCLLVIQFGRVSEGVVLLSWLYVVFRYLHSGVHCFYNRVPLRLPLFLSSVTLLGALWVWFLVG
jgi:hypothetical protein